MTACFFSGKVNENRSNEILIFDDRPKIASFNLFVKSIKLDILQQIGKHIFQNNWFPKTVVKNIDDFVKYNEFDYLFSSAILFL